MTHAKKLKREIRTRARKTGESYTSARGQVLHARLRGTRRAKAPVVAPAESTSSTARKTAAKPSTPRTMSDASVIKKTGKGFDHWFAVLDVFGSDRGHTAFADHLRAQHSVPGWHAQMITVAYERARGLRVANQTSDGRYHVSVSRAVPVPVGEAVDALRDPARRARWLAPAAAEVRRALHAAFEGPKPRQVVIRDAQTASLRFKWDDATVEIDVVGKKGGASVVASTTNLRALALVEVRRAQWATALDSLRAHLRS